jgi:ABC-type oligopeptide transport system substrate-binding subunit
MYWPSISLLRISLLVFSSFSQVHAGVFKFHVMADPHTIDAQAVSSTSGNFLIQSIYRGLFSYHSKRGLELNGAKKCWRGPKTLTCTLSPTHRWSTGERIEARDYVRSFRRLANPDFKSPQAELVFTLKNGREIVQGKQPPRRLGVRELGRFTLRFEFAVEDPEFEYKLMNAATAPWPDMEIPGPKEISRWKSSGAFKISEWKPGHRVHFVRNEFYTLRANPHRPDLEALLVDNDGVALRLYENGDLSFLRHLAFMDTPRYRGRPDFFQLPMARMDYFGFGPELADLSKLRLALLSSIDFATFQSLTPTKGPFGCVGLPRSYFAGEPVCLKYDPKLVKALRAEIPKVPKLTLYFSQMGGEDSSQTTEWLQGQWRKNGFDVELSSEEQIVYLRHIRTSPPQIFRKGLPLDRPTCLAGLESFTTASRDNYLKIDDAEYEKMVREVAKAKSPQRRRTLCRQALVKLYSLNRMIPAGEMYFTVLVSPRFRGWDINELNQLDLSQLTEVQDLITSSSTPSKSPKK